MEALRHLLLLCCYGGVPYIEYGSLNQAVRHESTHTIDPTDWIAVDSSGSLLNASIHPELLAENPDLARLIPTGGDVDLDQCDLFNLTFSSTDDQKLYDGGHGLLRCRCPRRRFGAACHLKAPTIGTDGVAHVAAALIGTMDADGGSGGFNMILLCFMCLIGVMAGIFMMMRGCFCDCFGGFKNPFGSEPRTELNPEAVRRCLSAVNKYEENQQKRWGVPESRHPLIPSVSEGCAPYATTVMPAGRYEIVPPPPCNCSPPPSYRSVQGSFEHLPGNTKL